MSNKRISFAGFANTFAFILIAYASYLLILLSLPYIYFKSGVEFLATKQLIYHIDEWRISFYIHVFASPLVIVSGLLQFNRWIMRKSPRFHKICGYIYIIDLLLITGPAAMIMSFYANGGRIAQTSFVLLSFCWVICTFLAYYFIRKKNFKQHVNWMLRSYALTLSAVTLRFYAYLFDLFEVRMGPVETYILLAYISWIPNLLIAQLLIKLRYPEYLLKYKD